MHNHSGSDTKTQGSATSAPDAAAELVRRHGLTPEQAAHLVAKHGNEPKMLHIAASKMNGRAPNG